MKKVDILAFGVHPDDVELGCAGTLIKSVDQGMRVGICDLTAGELGTRGSAKIRLEEAEEGRKVIGADFRVNLGMSDGFFESSQENQLKIIEIIRACKPDIVLCNAIRDRHPDHGRSAELVKVSCFLSGLHRIDTTMSGVKQEKWRPANVYHYVQDNFIEPNLVIDVTKFWDQKMKAIKAFDSQFFNPNSSEPSSAISTKEFLAFVEGRGLQMGRLVGVNYAEGFTSDRPIGAVGLKNVF